jgi:hypothetical protein
MSPLQQQLLDAVLRIYGQNAPSALASNSPVPQEAA